MIKSSAASVFEAPFPSVVVVVAALPAVILTQTGVESKALTLAPKIVQPLAHAVHVKYDPVMAPTPATAVVAT
jgi:hypothetical protein